MARPTHLVPVFCSYCDKKFSNTSNFKRHRKNVHGRTEKVLFQHEYSAFMFKCHDCRLSFRKNAELRLHLERKHDFDSQFEEFEFSSYNEFNEWLRKEELENNIRYQKPTGSKTKLDEWDGIQRSYFHCSRSGKPYQSRMKKRAKRETYKINFYCTSQIIVNHHKPTDKVNVKYFKTHYGHKNINIKDGCRDPNDVVSINLLIEEYKKYENNPVVFYKKRGEKSTEYISLVDDDICIIFMNEVQANMLRQFGENVICVDGTSGLDPSSSFEMVMVSVTDEYNRGFPVAFMLTNRQDDYINFILFSEIKKRVGKVNASIFMGDTSIAFYKAWRCIMAATEKQLFSAWHVQRALQKNLERIKDSKNRKHAYETYRNLQRENDIGEFKTKYDKLRDWLASNGMAEYPGKEFSTNVEQWAYCYRKDSGKLCTNMRDIVKYAYQHGSKKKRLDKAFHRLQRFLRTKTLDRIVKSNDIAKYLGQIDSRHSAALTVSYDIHCESNHYVVSDDSESYVISKSNCSDLDCPLICACCSICVHSYSCTCLDFYLNSTICSHVHYVCLKTNRAGDEAYFSSDEEGIKAEELLLVIEKDSSDDDIKENNELKEEIEENMDLQVVDSCNESVDETDDLLAAIPTVHDDMQYPNTTEALLEEIQNTALKIISSVHTGNYSDENLQLILNTLKSAVSIDFSNSIKKEEWTANKEEIVIEETDLKSLFVSKSATYDHMY